MVVGVLFEECIMGVEMGGCLYMVIWEDVLINFEVVDWMFVCFFDVDIVFIEFGGDNFVVMFSFELLDLMIYVIDVVGGEKILCKGGFGIMKFDLFVINKIDFVLLVGVNFDVMVFDMWKMCGEWFYVMMNLKVFDGVVDVIVFIEKKGLLMV